MTWRPQIRDTSRRRAVAVALSVAAHGAMFLVLLTPKAAPPPEAPTPEPMVVALVAPRPPTPPAAAPEPKPEPAPKAAPEKPEPKPPAPPQIVRPTPAPPREAPVRLARAGSTPDAAAVDASAVGAAELGAAARAGAGPAGGDCDMARWLQTALAKDPKVRAAVLQAQGDRAAIRVWNGGWVKHTGQEGAGLAAVREVLTWEIAFAPKACRSQPVHGLVLFSLGEGPGSARIVVGQAEWRWADLLFAQPGSSGGGVS